MLLLKYLKKGHKKKDQQSLMKLHSFFQIVGTKLNLFKEEVEGSCLTFYTIEFLQKYLLEEGVGIYTPIITAKI